MTFVYPSLFFDRELYEGLTAGQPGTKRPRGGGQICHSFFMMYVEVLYSLMAVVQTDFRILNQLLFYQQKIHLCILLFFLFLSSVLFYVRPRMSESTNSSKMSLFLFFLKKFPTQLDIFLRWCQGLIRPQVPCTPSLHCPIASSASTQSQQPV